MARLVHLETVHGRVVFDSTSVVALTEPKGHPGRTRIQLHDGSQIHVSQDLDLLVREVWPSRPSPVLRFSSAFADPVPEVLEVEHELAECELKGWEVTRIKGKWQAKTRYLGDCLTIVAADTVGALIESARAFEREVMDKVAAGDAE